MSFRFRNFATTAITGAPANGHSATATRFEVVNAAVFGNALATNEILVVVAETPGSTPQMEVMNVTNINGNILTVTRGQEGSNPVVLPNDTKIYTTFTSAQAKLLQGDLDVDITPEVTETNNLGSDTKRMNEVHAKRVKVDGSAIGRGAGADFILPPQPASPVVLATKLDTVEKHPGFLQGQVAVVSSGELLADNYKLVGGDRGDVVFVVEFVTTGDDQHIRLISRSREVLLGNADDTDAGVFGVLAEGTNTDTYKTQITYSGLASVVDNIKISADQNATWHTMTIPLVSGRPDELADRTSFLTYLETRTIGTEIDFEPAGSFEIGRAHV